jgi:hypothetical protein
MGRSTQLRVRTHRGFDGIASGLGFCGADDLPKSEHPGHLHQAQTLPDGLSLQLNL